MARKRKKGRGWHDDPHRHSLSARGIPNKKLTLIRERVAVRAIAMAEMRLAEQRGHDLSAHEAKKRTEAQRSVAAGKAVADRLLGREVQAIEGVITVRMKNIMELREQKAQMIAKLERQRVRAGQDGDLRTVELLAEKINIKRFSGRTRIDREIRGEEAAIERLRDNQQLEVLKLKKMEVK